MIRSLIFQSTLPAWGATSAWKQQIADIEISIHAPRVGSDGRHGTASPPDRHFNPRSPRGERRRRQLAPIGKHEISIHAPRVGSDLPPMQQTDRQGHFNPRSPRGERLDLKRGYLASFLFQSTLPAWGATLPSHVFYLTQTSQVQNTHKAL